MALHQITQKYCYFIFYCHKRWEVKRCDIVVQDQKWKELVSNFSGPVLIKIILWFLDFYCYLKEKKSKKNSIFSLRKRVCFYNHINVSPLGTCIENNSNDIQNKYKYLDFYCFILPLTMFIITPFTYQSYLDQGCASIYQQHI